MIDGDDVWKRFCGDWHWWWSRSSDGEGDGEQDGEDTVDSGGEGAVSLGASHTGLRESASGGALLTSAHDEPAGGSQNAVEKVDGDDKDGGGDGEGELDEGGTGAGEWRRGAVDGAGAGARAGDGAGARAQAEVVVESDGITG